MLAYHKLSAYITINHGLFQHEPGSHNYTYDVLPEGGLRSFQNARQGVAVVPSPSVELRLLLCFSKHVLPVGDPVAVGLALASGFGSNSPGTSEQCSPTNHRALTLRSMKNGF